MPNAPAASAPGGCAIMEPVATAGSVVYLGLYDRHEDPGVHAKVIGTLRAAEAAGYQSRVWDEAFRGTGPLRRLIREVIDATETHLIVRSLGFANLFLLPAFCIARLQGKTIVVDVPTPHRVAVREVWNSPQSLSRRLRAVCGLVLSGPWSLWPASRIVEYAAEGWWFRLGNSGRTVRTGNGIDVASVTMRAAAPAWPAPVLRVLGVASTVSQWHGYDRLLRAAAVFQADPGRPFDLQITIAGGGAVIAKLQRLAEELSLTACVTFTGLLTREQLSALYEQSHLAVSSLGLHRIGLPLASVLKAREYCAIGIPFIAAGRDPDFPADVPFRIAVEPSEDLDSIVRAFTSFGAARSACTDAEIRRYAEDVLDFRHKLASLGLSPEVR